jgi:hypothetical protein
MLEDAAVTVLAPPAGQWNRLVLLFLHGHRPEGTARKAELDELILEDEHFAQLLLSGWVLGMTSYRREGRIIRDGMRDVRCLHLQNILLILC